MFKSCIYAVLGLIMLTASSDARTLRYTQTETHSASGLVYSIQGFIDTDLDLDATPSMGLFELTSVTVKGPLLIIDDISSSLKVILAPFIGNAVVGIYGDSGGIIPSFSDDVSAFDYDNPTDFEFSGFLSYVQSGLSVESASKGVQILPSGNMSNIVFAAVPLPATLPLVLVGTALLGWVGRRKN